jgi:hypothetical protein
VWEVGWERGNRHVGQGWHVRCRPQRQQLGRFWDLGWGLFTAGMQNQASNGVM